MPEIFIQYPHVIPNSDDAECSTQIAVEIGIQGDDYDERGKIPGEPFLLEWDNTDCPRCGRVWTDRDETHIEEQALREFRSNYGP